MLGSDLCNYSDAYIVVKGKITVEEDNDAKNRNKKLTFKDNASFGSRKSKIITHLQTISKILILLCQYILLEYSDNYPMISGSANNNRTNNKTVTSKSFEYKTKLLQSTPDDNNILGAKVVTLKYLSNFQRSVDLLLINCKIQFDLYWSKECIISEILIANIPNANPLVPDVTALQTTRATFQIKNATLYVPVVTLSINDNIKFQKILNTDLKE